MSKNMGIRVAGSLVTLAALAACADGPIAPTAIVAPQSPSLAVVIGTPPTVRRDLEGQVWVCKTSNSIIVQESFSFTFSATKPGGSTNPDLLPGNFSLKNGECAMIYAIDREVSVDRYAVSVTEGAMPNANWAFGSASASSIPTVFTNILSPPVIAGQTISDVGFIHDQGVIITFDNVYTPPTGCTYTQGYWKTHNNSFKGGAKADATWQLVGPLAEGETFYLSGMSWFAVFNTAPGGNQYYTLAHQYMAAKLNQLGGATVPGPVATAIGQAEALFALYTPAQIAALKGSTAPRPTFVSLAGILGSYNEGLTGPGHCE